MEERLNELPKGWVWTQLDKISDIILGQSPPSATYNENKIGLPFFQGKSEFGNIYPIPRKWCSEPKKIAEKGAILISVRAPVGPTNVCPERSCIGRGLAAIRSSNYINSFFLLYYLRRSESEIAKKGTGSTFTAISGRQLREIDIPLPPLAEQHRIVEKIEELFSRLDAGVESLKKVHAQIKRYRQVVLKQAFEGKLTAAWREANKRRLEPASILLERIKEGKKQKKSGKQEELNSLDTSSLHSIPVMWKWARIGELCSLMQYGTSEKANKSNTGYPILRMGNIQNGGIIFDDLKYMLKEWKKVNDFILQRGDILFNRTNSAELVGKSAVFKNYHLPVVFASYLIRVRTKIDPFYVSNYINSYYGRLYIISVVSQQVGQANVSATKLSNMPIPLPSLEEQQKIVEEIERRFSIADRIEEIVEQNLKRAERLRQSILKKAFEGKLVPQDPTDEPASVLLERIKAEKEKSK